jgi:hypothetical protein
MYRFASANVKVTLITVAAALSLLSSAGSALAFNPQPDPPASHGAPVVSMLPAVQMPGH